MRKLQLGNTLPIAFHSVTGDDEILVLLVLLHFMFDKIRQQISQQLALFTSFQQKKKYANKYGNIFFLPSITVYKLKVIQNLYF